MEPRYTMIQSAPLPHTHKLGSDMMEMRIIPSVITLDITWLYLLNVTFDIGHLTYGIKCEQAHSTRTSRGLHASHRPF